MVRPSATTAACNGGSPGPEGRLGGPAALGSRVLPAPPPSPHRRYAPRDFGEPAPRCRITARRSSSLPQVTMAEFAQQRGKRRDDGGLGGVLDLLLANARLVLGVSGAAVLAIATLAVKRVRLGGSPSAARGDVPHHVSERCLVVFILKSVGSLCASLSLSNRCFSPVEELCVTVTPRVCCPLGWEVLSREQLVCAGFPCGPSVSLLFQQ